MQRPIERVLVTGCAGFIGSHLVDFLLEAGVSVLGLDCLTPNYGRDQKIANLRRATDWASFEFVPSDLATEDLSTYVADCDVLFHLAAEPGVRASWGTGFGAYLRNNIYATQRLLEAARRQPQQRLVFASSSSIYGDAEALPTREDACPRPFSPYGVTKLAAEHLCALYHANYGVDVVRLRYFSVYGPRQRPDMAFHAFCRAAIRNDPLTILGDGEQTRDFTFCSDIVRATWAAARAPGLDGLSINVGGGSQVTLNSVIARIADLAGRDLELRYGAPTSGDVRNTSADLELARRHLDYEPIVGLESGLEAEFRWLAELDGVALSSGSPNP